MKTLPVPAKATLHALARESLELFLRISFAHLNPGEQLTGGWYIEAMAQALEDVAKGDCRRLLITLPPRHLKSITTSVVFPAWLLGRNPAMKIMCVTYGADLGDTHVRDFRRIIDSSWYRSIFPATAASITTNNASEIATAQGGRRYSITAGGAVTGKGADIIILDDVVKAQEAQYPEALERANRFIQETLWSRLNDKKTASIVAAMQRLAENDVAGRLIEMRTFRHLNLPAIAVKDEDIPLTRGRVHRRKIRDVLNPDREPIETLEEQRRDLGPRVFETQYQQDTAAAGGDHVRWESIQFYDTAPERSRLTKIVHSWDTASSIERNADYSVGTVWGYDFTKWYLLDLYRVRLVPTDLLARMRLERKRWRADVILVEKAGAGDALFDFLFRDRRGQGPPEHHTPGCAVVSIKPTDTKQERLMSHMELLYTGVAQFPRQAPWLEDLRRELRAFPDCSHDDQCDSISQFLKWAVGRRGQALVRPPGYRPPGRPRRSARSYRRPLIDPFE